MANFLTRLMDRLLGDRTEGVAPRTEPGVVAALNAGGAIDPPVVAHPPSSVAKNPQASADARRERMEREQRERHVAMDRARRREATRQDVSPTRVDDLHDVRTLGTMAAIHAATTSDDWSERGRSHHDHPSSSRSDQGSPSSHDGGPSSSSDHSSSSSSSSSDFSSSSY